MPTERPELLSRPQLEARQWERLRQLLELLPRNPFWSRRFAETGWRPDECRSLADFQRLPLLTKQELVDDQLACPPFGTNVTFPLTGYSRLHQTSGTTGRPMRWLDTPDSWNWFLQLWEQIYRLVDIRDDDIFAFPFSFGPFIGFWAAFEGAQRRGNLSLAMGGMSSEARLRMILELEATIVCCTPTYALRLAEVAEQLQLPIHDSPVRMLIVAGEPGGNVPVIRHRIESAWGARLIDHWGMTDVGSLGIEPAAAPGGQLILETECIAEIVDPESGMPVTAGTPGELIITNLGRTGQPVLRYRTGDLVRADTGPNADGTSLLRLAGGVLGRVDDMVSIRGNNVFPSSLDAILHEFPEIAEYRVIVQTVRSMPHLKIEIEPQADAREESKQVPGLLGRVQRTIKDRLNFQAEVVAASGLPRFEMKARRFVRQL